MTEVAPRIHRIGADMINAWLVEDGGEVVIVDAGAPAYYDELLATLTAMGRSPADVRGVVLTHGHSDHIGMAERVRRHGVTVRVHEADEALAQRRAPNSVKISGGIRPLPILR